MCVAMKAYKRASSSNRMVPVALAMMAMTPKGASVSARNVVIRPRTWAARRKSPTGALPQSNWC